MDRESLFRRKTAISYKTEEKTVLRGYDLSELAEAGYKFADAMFVLFQGRLPTENESEMLDYEMAEFLECSMSARLRRENGRPRSAGISQARALTSTTTAGGKSARSSSPGSLAKPGEAFLEETLAPLGHDLTGQVQALADLLVAQTLSGKEDDLGAHDVAIR